MSQGGYVTLIGFVAREPSLRTTKDGRQVADVRVGATTRYFDKDLNMWRDGDTSYYTVNCWRRLAGHVRAGLHKGDPVMVKGRFRTHTYEDKQNRIRTEVEIVADTIGHDLSRGIANYIRPERPRQDAADDLAEGDSAGLGLGAGNPDDPGAQGAVAFAGGPPFADPGAGERVGEEEAVEQLHRDLDRELAEGGELGMSGLAVRDLDESASPAEEAGEPAGEPLPF